MLVIGFINKIIKAIIKLLVKVVSVLMFGLYLWLPLAITIVFLAASAAVPFNFDDYLGYFVMLMLGGAAMSAVLCVNKYLISPVRRIVKKPGTVILPQGGEPQRPLAERKKDRAAADGYLPQFRGYFKEQDRGNYGAQGGYGGAQGMGHGQGSLGGQAVGYNNSSTAAQNAYTGTQGYGHNQGGFAGQGGYGGAQGTGYNTGNSGAQDLGINNKGAVAQGGYVGAQGMGNSQAGLSGQGTGSDNSVITPKLYRTRKDPTLFIAEHPDKIEYYRKTASGDYLLVSTEALPD